MGYLLDSDVVKKLAQYHLLCELASSLQCEISSFAVLPQLKYQLKLSNPHAGLEKLGTECAVNAVNTLVAEASEVSVDNPHNPILQLNIPGIDTGEQVLFAALAECSEYRLISGDKCAFRALSKLNGPQVIHGLWPRMYCLEQVVAIMIETHGFETISGKIRTRPDVDIALTNIFGRYQAAGPSGVQEGLSSYITGLVQETGELFPNFYARC